MENTMREAVRVTLKPETIKKWKKRAEMKDETVYNTIQSKLITYIKKNFHWVQRYDIIYGDIFVYHLSSTPQLLDTPDV